jgi:hypothetical protein
MATTLNPMVLIDPTVTTIAASSDMAIRPTNLTGLTIGLLNNGKAKADIILDTAYNMLCELYDLPEPVRHSKGSASQPFAQDVIDNVVNECRIAITAIGD